MKYLETDFRRYYPGTLNEANASLLVDYLGILLKTYTLYVDVIANLATSRFGLKDVKNLVINYRGDETIKQNHYLCLRLTDKEEVSTLFDAGLDYLEYQFRFCNGEAGPISDEEVLNLERLEEISETLFDDSRVMAVLKDKPDCLGMHIKYRVTIETECEKALIKIAGLSNK